MKSRRVTTRNYDLAGNPIGRVLRRELIFRLIPIGNFGGGPNLIFLLRLWVLHKFGRILYRLALFINTFRSR